MITLALLALLSWLLASSPAEADVQAGPPTSVPTLTPPEVNLAAPDVPPAVLAPTAPGVIVTAPPATRPTLRPVIAMRPLPTTYEVGRGLLGQPKLYVPRQPVRNFVRYFTP